MGVDIGVHDRLLERGVRLLAEAHVGVERLQPERGQRRSSFDRRADRGRCLLQEVAALRPLRRFGLRGGDRLRQRARRVAHGRTPTLATLPPKAGAPFAPWGGPAAQMWTPTLAASLNSAATLPPKAGAPFAPWGGPAALIAATRSARVDG